LTSSSAALRVLTRASVGRADTRRPLARYEDICHCVKGDCELRPVMIDLEFEIAVLAARLAAVCCQCGC
jgi:hypothetical protein